jgi:septal ring factor EnvC (AmiA/AmiB activator)
LEAQGTFILAIHPQGFWLFLEPLLKSDYMRYAAIIIFLLLGMQTGFAQQSRADLERRRQSILQSIKESQQQLEETKKNKNATMSQLRALQAKLDARLRLIGNINQEMQAIDGSIKSSTQEVGHLRSNLEVLKIRYAQSIRYAYASRSSSSMLAFLFSSNDYNDAVRRLKYLKRYRDYRQQQAEEIRATQGRIENKIGELNTVKSQKDLLLAAEEQQRRVLMQETSETNNVVKELKTKEKQLITDIEKNRKTARQVERAVASIIQREIEEQRRKAQEEARRAAAAEEARRRAEEARRVAANSNYGGMTVNTGSGSKPATPNASGPAARTPAGTTPSAPPVASSAATTRPKKTAAPVDLSLTPEAQALSNSFASNQGRLPWPVERGTITGYFGPHKHPVADVTITNDGIDIQTSTAAPVRAVFEGNVSGVFYVPGSGQNVIIQHGGYYTVYANLASVSVRKDQNVNTKQTIGTVGNNDEGVPVINFQIWKSASKGSSKLNPSSWIAK